MDAEDLTTIPEERVYPSEHHFRIIVNAEAVPWEALASILAGYAVSAPLSAAGCSRGGRYQSLQVSVHVQTRAELVRLHADLRAVDGVRMLI